MPVKKPSVKPAKAKKTVSAKAVKPTPKVASKAKAVAHKPVAAKPVAKVAPKPAPKGEVRARPADKASQKVAQKAQTAVRLAASPSARPDAAELEASASLLSGPRNVQPYVIRKGEEYMSKEQLEHFRTILSSWKQDLMQEVDRTVLHMKDEAANFPDPNDRATQESEFSLELRTRDRERKLIRKIEEALKRIEDGSYGYCLETGEPIGVKRLEARPVATLSVEAQERRERREKQFGDRDDWYR
jgi:DnaK suppressor protein